MNPQPHPTNPSIEVFMDQSGVYRPSVNQELRRLQAVREPLPVDTPYDPPFDTVSMRQIEAFPITNLYGAPPADQLEEVTEDEDEEVEGYVRSALGGYVVSKPKLRPGLVTLDIGREACRRLKRYEDWKAQRRSHPPSLDEYERPMPKKPRVDNTPNTNRTESANTISPQATFSPARTGTPASRTITTPSKAPPTMPSDPSLRPILNDIWHHARVVHMVQKNKDGLPTKSILWQMDGFVSSKGHMKADNPLRDWFGDLRLFDMRTWRYLAGLKGEA